MRWIKVANDDTETLIELLWNMVWETRAHGGLTYRSLRAYAKGYRIKPKKLQELYQKMLDMKLIIVQQK
jgi:hypothetical protein